MEESIRLDFGRYLGLQADFGHSKKKVFAEVRDKIEARTAGWAEQYLSQAGKEVLVKAVAMAMPNYAMSCFKLPIGVCQDIEKAFRNYWWRGGEKSKGVHWVAWDRVKCQKKSGGLGFRDIQCVNLAFLAKVGWRIIQNPNSLITVVLKEKYFPGKSFMTAAKGRSTSWGWKGIFDARKVLMNGIRWRVGNGRSINIREDPWIPQPTSFKVIPTDGSIVGQVSDLINLDCMEWNEGKIINGFNSESAKMILSIPLSRSGQEDRLVWNYTKNGSYSVKSGYGVALDLMTNGELGKKGRGAPSKISTQNQVWNQIWRLKVPNKLKIFLWRCCNNALAVRKNLTRRHMRVDNVCGVCGTRNETENHIFFRCEVSHVFWFCSPLHLNSWELEGSDFLDSWHKFCSQIKDKTFSDEIAQEFVFGLWRIWKNRNGSVFNGLQQNPTTILETWRSSLSEYRAAIVSDSSSDHSMRTTIPTERRNEIEVWRKPRFGVIKVNTDAAWCKDTNRSGYGWVARDFAGILIAAGGSGRGACQNATAAEAWALRESLLCCLEYGFDHVIFESDSLVVIRMLRKEMEHDFNFECILSDIEKLAQRMKTVSFEFVPRECNKAAHSVARYVFKMEQDFEWDCIGPEFLFNILAQDVNISIRL